MGGKIAGQWNPALYEDSQTGCTDHHRPVLTERYSDAPQPIQHDVECLEKAVETLFSSLRELNERLDLVLNPEGPQCGAGSDLPRPPVCPLAERIQRIISSVRDATHSVSRTRDRLAL